MIEQASISVRIESGLKAEAEGIFRELGISITEAISLFYQYVKQNKELPFEVRTPNKTTLQTFQDTDNGHNIIRCKNTEEIGDCGKEESWIKYGRCKRQKLILKQL